MLRLLKILLAITLTIIFVFDTNSAFAKFERIKRDSSHLDVKIENIDNSLLQYYYGGWNEKYEYQTYIILFRNRLNNQYLQIKMVSVANDEYYWESVSDTTVDTIKGLRYFRDKSISIIFESDGINAGYDSVAGEPSYLLFSADNQNCSYMRRISVFGPHGGTVEPYIISGFYCAPDGERLTKAQAKAIAENGLIFVEKPSGDAPTQLSKAVIDPVQAGLIAAGSPNPPAAQRSARSSIHKLFSGTTLARNEGSANVIEVFSTDGTMTGKRVLSGPNVNGIPDEDSGKWSTDNEGRICLAWAKWNEGKTSCHAVSTGDRTIRLLSPSGWVLREYAVLSRPEPKPVAKPKREKPPKVARIEIKPEEIPDGELSADQIKALLTGTNVALANTVDCDEFDNFGSNGSNCRIYHAFQTSSVIRTTAISQFGSEEENGRWWVQDKNSLCLEWPRWFGGKQQCYRVIKTGMKMMLTDSRGWSTVYLIEEK